MMQNLDPQLQSTLDYLLSPQAIRERCEQLFDWVQAGGSPHFRCDLGQLEPTVHYVLQITQENYPTGQIPFHSRWRHFEVGGIDRQSQLDQALGPFSPQERARAKFDLAVISVLLDAGAGSTWGYREPGTEQIYVRSEGLAVASFHSFCQGRFSSDLDHPYQVDGAGLASLTLGDLAACFQVTDTNPLVGLEGRLQLMHRLGQALRHHPQLFGDPPRPGHWVDHLLTAGEAITASQVLQAVLQGLTEIWPSRVSLQGIPLGDVWPHPALSSVSLGSNLIPFHKLSQWLTYSLLEPLQELGIEIKDIDQLTGLAEYRNGGLCLDLGLITPQRAQILEQPHPPGSEVIVEWRALTIALLDRIAARMRDHLGCSRADLPLVKVLQGGTWVAGRRLAQQRPGGKPPLQLVSDGTVF